MSLAGSDPVTKSSSSGNTPLTIIRSPSGTAYPGEGKGGQNLRTLELIADDPADDDSRSAGNGPTRALACGFDGVEVDLERVPPQLDAGAALPVDRTALRLSLVAGPAQEPPAGEFGAIGHGINGGLLLAAKIGCSTVTISQRAIDPRALPLVPGSAHYRRFIADGTGPQLVVGFSAGIVHAAHLPAALEWLAGVVRGSSGANRWCRERLTPVNTLLVEEQSELVGDFDVVQVGEHEV